MSTVTRGKSVWLSEKPFRGLCPHFPDRLPAPDHAEQARGPSGLLRPRLEAAVHDEEEAVARITLPHERIAAAYLARPEAARQRLHDAFGERGEQREAGEQPDRVVGDHFRVGSIVHDRGYEKRRPKQTERFLPQLPGGARGPWPHRSGASTPISQSEASSLRAPRVAPGSRAGAQPSASLNVNRSRPSRVSRIPRTPSGRPIP